MCMYVSMHVSCSTACILLCCCCSSTVLRTYLVFACVGEAWTVCGHLSGGEITDQCRCHLPQPALCLWVSLATNVCSICMHMYAYVCICMHMYAYVCMLHSFSVYHYTCGLARKLGVLELVVGWLFLMIKHANKWLVTSNCHFNATFHPSWASSGIK